MTSELLPASAYIDLPRDKIGRLERLTTTARDNLKREAGVDPRQVGNSDSRVVELRRIYGATMNEVADKLGLGKLYPAPDGTSYDHERLETALDVKLAGLRLDSALAGGPPPSDTSLSRITRVSLRRDVNRLEELIEHSELSDKHKARLLKKLAELRAALNEDGFDMMKLLTTMAAIATVFGGTSSGLANTPKAIEGAPVIWEHVQHMLGLIGDEELAEEAEHDPQLLLPPPAKALPDFSEKT